MIAIAICDDDSKSIKLHEEIILSGFPGDLLKIFTYESSRNFLFDMKEGKYFDIILLDIEMPGLDGMELAVEIKNILPSALIIFITSHRKYAIDSFELSIFRYVPKDEVHKRLLPSISSAISYVKLQDKDMYSISTPTRFERIPYKEIIYIKKEGKYASIVTSAGSTYIRKSLDRIQSELKCDQFIFSERAYIVNILNIIRLNEDSLLMKNDSIVPVSKKRMPYLREILNQYWGDNL